MKPTNRQNSSGVRSALTALASLAAVQFAGAQTIPNPSFESNSFTVSPGYVSLNAAITDWVASPTDRVGLNPASGIPFANNGTIPDGSNVAFLQSRPPTGDVFLETDITGLTVGTKYKVSFRINARGASNVARLKVWTHAVGDALRTPTSTPVAMHVNQVGGTAPYKYAAYEFTATDVSQTLTLNNYTTAGDHTALVDNFSIATSSNAWSYSAWTGDANSGVDSSYVYTHAYSFGGSAVNSVVNGVDFTARGGGNPTALRRFAVTGLGSAFGDVTRTLSGGSNSLGKSFIYGGPNMGITIENLKPNTEYVATIYGVAFDLQPFARAATFSSSLAPDDRLTVDLDHFNQTNGIKVEYRYTTDASGTPVTLSYVQTGDGSFHTSGFSNREAVASTPAPDWTAVAWNDDATSGVSPNHVYTHAYNFGSAASPNINGVPFTGVGGANPAAATFFTTTNLGGVFNNDPNTTTGFGSRTLANDFVYNGFPTVLNMTGLTPGKQYVLTIYSEGWEAAGARFGSFQGSLGAPATIIDQDLFGDNNGIRIEHTYTAPASGAYAITSLPRSGNSIHYYGFSNRESDPMVDVAPVITIHPASANVERTGTVTFRAAAIGSATLSYQWQFNNSDIPGETGVTLTLSGITTANQGSYRCVVSNGTGSTPTNPAALNVLDLVPGLFDTGYGNNCAVLTDGSADPHYLLLTNPDGDSLIPAVVEDSLAFPIVTGPWLANTATSKWIGPRLNTAASAGEAVDAGAGTGVYVYRTTFDLTGFDRSTVTISGGWAMDNLGVDIKVNDGHPDVTNASTGIVNNTGFATAQTFTISSANATFVDGINTIDFHVRNQTVAVGYTGLRIVGLKGLGIIPANTPPYIAVQPVDTEVRRNVATCLSVQASGSADLSYQWYKVTPGGPFLIPGANASTLLGLVTTPAEAAEVAGQYYCVVSNSAGSPATSATATVTVANAIPVAASDTFAAAKDTAATVTAASFLQNDSDGDSDILTVTSVGATSTAGGTVVLSAGSVIYTPPATFTGADSFTYSIDDGWGGTANGTVNVNVYTGSIPDLGDVIYSSTPTTQDFRFRGVPGLTYILQRSTDLATWADLNTQVAPADGILEFQDLSPLDPRSLYRIINP